MYSFVSHTVPSRSNTKAVQTEDRMLSLDFPTPPPAITESNEYSEQAPDDYLTLKVKHPSLLLPFLFAVIYLLHLSLTINLCQQQLDRVDRQAETQDRPQNQEEQNRREKEKDKEKELVKEKIQEKEEKQQLSQELNVLEEKAKTLRDGKDKPETSNECLYVISLFHKMKIYVYIQCL